MRPQTLYLETSIWGYLMEEAAPQQRADTMALFAEIEQFKREIYISSLVVEELTETRDAVRRKAIMEALEHFRPLRLPVEEAARALAEKYVAMGAIPPAAGDDATHVAVATVQGIDIVVSLNMRHIVRVRTRQGINAVNKLEGYREIEIATPTEVLEYGESNV